MCDATHPEFGRQCEVPGNHSVHAYPEMGPTSLQATWIEWPNESYGGPSQVALQRYDRKGRPTYVYEISEIMAEAALTAPSNNPTILARADDPETSKAGARSIVMRSTTHKAMLLVEFARGPETGMTDEEAARACGLLFKPKCCWWHRATDLRTDGLIVPTGGTRPSEASGEDLMVCMITREGVRAVASLR